jgi:hypothetical protein
MSEPGFTFVEVDPGPALRPYVTRLMAYRECYAAPVTRAQAAMPGAVLILGFGSALEVAGERLTSFGSGLADRFTMTRTAEPTEGVEVWACRRWRTPSVGAIATSWPASTTRWGSRPRRRPG